MSTEPAHLRGQLLSGRGELLRRVVAGERQTRMKLVNPDLARRMNELPRFRTAHPNTLDLDVTRIAAEEAADRIIGWAQQRKALDDATRL